MILTSIQKRDAGWIHTLLEEAENERMHLMAFMTLKVRLLVVLSSTFSHVSDSQKPSIWFRAVVIGAQGVFYNAFFLGYIISMKSAHRFVGFLEEEAMST
jgi:ubiquinol oxidase